MHIIFCLYNVIDIYVCTYCVCLCIYTYTYICICTYVKTFIIYMFWSKINDISDLQMVTLLSWKKSSIYLSIYLCLFVYLSMCVCKNLKFKYNIKMICKIKKWNIIVKHTIITYMQHMQINIYSSLFCYCHWRLKKEKRTGCQAQILM